MKLRNLKMCLLLLLAAGCDTMDRDVDGKTLSINKDAVYFLPGSDGYIDLSTRVISPGKIKVEITGITRNGELKNIGKGLLQYSPYKGSSSDSFSFRVLSSDNKVLGEDTVGIIIPTDTTDLPCKYVYTRNDSVKNVSGPVTINVTANDYSCSGSLTIFVEMAPEHGTATVVDNKILYVPNASFAGSDHLLYKADSSDPSLIPGLGMVRIIGRDSIPSDTTNNCVAFAKDDLFYELLNDSSISYLDVLTNDHICSDSTITITKAPYFGIAFTNGVRGKIGYRNKNTTDVYDTIYYKVGSSNAARVLIKRE